MQDYGLDVIGRVLERDDSGVVAVHGAALVGEGLDVGGGAHVLDVWAGRGWAWLVGVWFGICARFI